MMVKVSKASKDTRHTSRKRIIITGAAGEVGMNIMELIDHDKYDILAIDKNSHNLKILKKLFPKVDVLDDDLAISGGWMEHFKGAYAVIQLQAQISNPNKEPYLRNNIESVKNVIKACEKYSIKRLIHISSSVVISVAKDHYTDTKRSGEEIVKRCKIPHIILRPTLMYGCYDIKHLDYLVKMFERFPIFPMPGSGKYIRQPLFVEDFANIIINCIEMRMDGKAYNITGKEKINLIDCLKKIFKAKKKRILFVRIPLPIFHMLIHIYGFFNRKTKIVPDQLTALTAGDIFPVIDWDKKFSVKPTPFDDGVKKMVSSKHYKYGYEMKGIEG